MITGAKNTKINGQSYSLRFSWAALAEVAQEYGESPDLFDPKVLAFVGSAGLREKHPEMTTERLIEMSPPLVPFANDVQQALTWAYFGDKTPIGGDVKKKLPLIGWISHTVKRLLPGSAL